MQKTFVTDASSLDQLIRHANDIGETVVSRERTLADQNGAYVSESMEALKKEKLTGLVVPRELGGHGMGLFSLARISETLGTHYSSVGLCFGMHCVGSAVIAAKATAWHQEKYLEPIARGQHITTLALSEPGTGAHFYFPQTSLMPMPNDTFLVNGGKTFVTNGGHSDSYVVSTMAAAEDASPEQFSCVVIDSETDGLEWGRPWNGLGMRGNSSRSLKLNNVTIPANNILGEPGDQLWYVFNIVAPYFLIAMSGTYLGIAKRALQEGKDVLLKRVYAHNGTHLAQISLLQHRLGVLWARVERTRQLIYSAAMQYDSGEPNAIPALLAAKAEVASCCVDTVNDVMTLAGGIGYADNGILGLLLRDARASHVMSPTTDLLYTWLGRSLLDEPILSD
jgi:alkylation response protein AidB-like acyl-CoA dehydrogenase